MTVGLATSPQAMWSALKARLYWCEQKVMVSSIDTELFINNTQIENVISN